MNWYGKIIYSQIWVTDSDESFQEDLIAFYELEYKLQSLKNFPFKGMPQRQQNIIVKLEESLEEIMDRLKDPLISTFGTWLDQHAITDPATWAEQRTDPYGDGFMSSFDAENNLEGIIGEYIRYKNNNNFGMNAYNRPNTETVFSEIFNQALSNIELFPSLKGLGSLVQEEERERLAGELSYDDFINFGENERGQAFSSEEEAEAYIEDRINNLDIADYFYGMGKESLLSFLEAQGTLSEFLIELNQHIVFPLWYNYWSAMGIDTTRELVEEAYKNLINARTFEEGKLALEEAVQVCHQNGSMLDYMGQYSEEYVNPDEIENIMTNLTGGNYNSKWDKDLIEIGVKIPASVRKNNKEMAMA